jgi:hypothetical protein
MAKSGTAHGTADKQGKPDESGNDPILREGDSAAEWRPRESVQLWDRNPRKNDDTARDVAENIRLLGFGSACMTWFDADIGADVLIAGNTRAKAVDILIAQYRVGKPSDFSKWHPMARAIARTGLIPCRKRNDLSRREATLMALSDNRIGEKTPWDPGPLGSILSEFSFDEIAIAGWSQADMDKMAADLMDPTPPDDFGEVDEGIDTDHECPKCGYKWSGGK